MQNDVTHIGMDLGSFNTSVASSNGKRAELMSAVGWPKDHVARAMLGRDVIFGSDILEQRLALNVVRPFEKGQLKYNDASTSRSQEEIQECKNAARLLVEHAVSLTEPDKDKPIYGVIGAPSRASLLNKQVITEAARSTFDAVVIVAEPFTVAYGMNRLSDTLVVDIGAGTIDVCPMFGTYPSEEDQFTIPTGGDAVDEKFFELIQAMYPEAQISMNLARTIKEKYGFVHDVKEQVMVSLPENGRPRKFDLTEPLREACCTLVPHIMEAIGQVISRMDPEFQRKLLDNILLGGGGSQLRGLDRLIEQELESFGGGNVRKAYDSVFAGANGALKLAMAMPQQYWEKLLAQSGETAAA